LGRSLIYVLHFGNELGGLNCKVYGISRHEPNRYMRPLRADQDLVLLQADLAEPFSFDEKVDYIFHAAGYAQPKLFLQEKLKTISLNVETAKALLELARLHGARLVFFSSGDIYGEIPRTMGAVPETYNGNLCPTAPRSIYGEAKRLGESICSIYRNDYNVQVYITRISHTYGPGLGIDDHRVLGDFIRKALLDREIRMLDQGDSIKTFGYISDIVAMLFKVMLEGNSLVYNIGGVDTMTIRQLAEAVAKHSGNVRVILPEGKSSEEHIGSDPKYCQLDISKFVNEFGPVDFMSFSEGIRRTIEWNKLEFGYGTSDRTEAPDG
jgi:dTDP-glucose 4,6-dehydratase/UDP-glucuronate decarboxylase